MTAVTNAMIIVILIMIVGFGLSSSATNGEKIVTALAIKLQIPIDVTRFKFGNTVMLL